MWVGSLDQEHPLKKGMASHFSILAWKIPWTEEPCYLWSRGLQRVTMTTPGIMKNIINFITSYLSLRCTDEYQAWFPHDQQISSNEQSSDLWNIQTRASQGQEKMKSLNCGDLSLANPDVWHLTNIIQDTLDWEQNECRERGSSFSESTTGNNPIKKQETQHKPDLCHCIFWALSLFPQHTHTHIQASPQWPSFPVLALPFLFKAFGKILFHFTLLPLSLEGLQKGSQNKWAEGSWIWIRKFWLLVISPMVTFSFKQSRKRGFSLHCSVSF